MASFLEKGAIVPNNIRILFLGDSITDNGTYIAHLSMYFKKFMPEKNIELINLGVNSETAAGTSEPDHPFQRPCVHERIDRALKISKPEWVFFCYGMNDGIYYPFSESRFEAYKKGITGIIDKVHSIGAKAIALTPPPFDTASAKLRRLLPDTSNKFSFREPYEGYDNVLKKYGEWSISELEGVADKIIDIHTPLSKFISSQRLENPDYVSGDGIHPDIKGHWIIANTILKELFNINLDRIPEYVLNPQDSSMFKAVMERHRTLSSAWKEHVGHTNPNKVVNELSLDKAIKKCMTIDVEISSMLNSEEMDYCVKESTWKGFVRHDFYVLGHEAILIKPKTHAPRNPWVWRTEFFDSFSFADMDLLKKGWHIVYFRISNMYGCPEAVDMMHYFSNYIVKKYDLANRADLFGFSRGGLYAVNFAVKYPQKVSGIYLDAPVLDIKSWPGGKGSGKGALKEWLQCLEVYGLNEESVKNFNGNPLDKVEDLVRTGIPIIVVSGDADKTVPYSENTEKFAEAYKRFGGHLKLVIKHGIDHHPHSLEETDEIVDFISEKCRS